MTLEQQVCSLELAKRLKELGVKQESCFWWCDPSDGDKQGVGFIRDNHVGYKVYFPAFTVAELGELLPEKVDHTYKSQGKWLMHWGRLIDPEGFVIAADTEADARAKALCYLIEQGIIKP